MKVLRDVLKRDIPVLLLWVLLTLGNACVFLLYGLLTEPLVYACVLSFFLIAGMIAVQYVRAGRRDEVRMRAAAGITECPGGLPEPETLAEEEYQQMILLLKERLETIAEAYETERRDALDYYTSWVHQIKTPIAVMKLKLREDTPENRALSAELFRIEQYVDMVLQYIRLGSGSNDLVIEEYDLDTLIRGVVRRYAPEFIEKKLTLVYAPCRQTVTTDMKWFSCILEQFLSNAVKYTAAGSVSITVTERELSVCDTGIGIAPEDLPRIFEKGFTGQNGRLGEKSSGLGLYLAGKAANLLALQLRAESEPGKGSRFTIVLPEKQ